MRDSQRQAVYNWENALRVRYPDAAKDIGLVGAKALVEVIFDAFQHPRKPPEVRDGRGRRVACYSPLHHAIKLPRWARSPIVVCHETAHAIDYATTSAMGGWHGPRFTTLLIEIWERYAGIPKEVALWAGINQKPRKVKFDLTNAK